MHLIATAAVICISIMHVLGGKSSSADKIWKKASDNECVALIGVRLILDHKISYEFLY